MAAGTGLLVALVAGQSAPTARDGAPVAIAPPPVSWPASCLFQAGTRARDTLDPVALASLGDGPLPLRHVIVLMQENRSYDHYFGRLSSSGQPDADGFPPSYGNHDGAGRLVRPFHLRSTCVHGDPPHQADSMRAQWNGGRMDGFLAESARVDGRSKRRAARHPVDDDDDDAGQFALGYYAQKDLPFYYYLANTFTIADRYFAAAMAGTWPNRQFLYTATAQQRLAPTAQLLGARTIFQELTAADVSWAVYTDGPPRQDCIGWTQTTPGVKPIASLWRALANGTLPAVSFVDPSADDEHPPADIQRGEGWARRLFQAATHSPAWAQMVLLYTYDEGGGFFDHVPPPAACPPDGARAEYDRRGARVPLIVISPWARRHHVSHVEHDHASVLRLIELMFNLPALTARDANADALLDAFDFRRPPALDVPPPPRSGRGGCRPSREAMASR